MAKRMDGIRKCTMATRDDSPDRIAADSKTMAKYDTNGSHTSQYQRVIYFAFSGIGHGNDQSEFITSPLMA